MSAERAFWLVVRRALLRVVASDDAFWIELRRALLAVVRADTAQSARKGVQMAIAAIERRYGADEAG